MASYTTYFTLCAGLKKPAHVPVGFIEGIEKRAKRISMKLSLKAPSLHGWVSSVERALTEFVPDGILDEISSHNDFVRILHGYLSSEAEQEKLQRQSQISTPLSRVIEEEEFGGILPYLQIISIPPAAWKEETYRSAMESLYETLRGRDDGVSLDEGEELTPKQAAFVINIISEWLEPSGSDLRLDVPDGYDYLASSYDGGYDWCDKCCKAIAESDAVEFCSYGCKDHGKQCGFFDSEDD
jgi:hypothetical protein